jgi:hypothetical protein
MVWISIRHRNELCCTAFGLPEAREANHACRRIDTGVGVRNIAAELIVPERVLLFCLPRQKEKSLTRKIHQA